MSFWKIAWRSLTERALASSLTGLSMALGVALMVLVLVIHDTVVNQLSNDAQGYNFIIASSQGSEYEAVLTTVFHLGKPLNTIPWRHYKEFVGEGKAASAFVDAELESRDRGARWVQIAFQPSLNARDKAAGVVAVLHDIGPLRDTEQALNLSAARLLARQPRPRGTGPCRP